MSSHHPYMTSDPPLSCLCLHLASPSPHRSPYKASLSKAERRKISTTSGPLEESHGAATAPKLPQVSLVSATAIYNVLLQIHFLLHSSDFEIQIIQWAKL